MTAMQDVKDAVGHDDRMRKCAGTFGELVQFADLVFEVGRRQAGAHGRLLFLSCLNHGELTASNKFLKARVASSEGTGVSRPSVPSCTRSMQPTARPAVMSPGLSPNMIDAVKSMLRSSAALRSMPGRGFLQLQSIRYAGFAFSGW